MHLANLVGLIGELIVICISILLVGGFGTFINMPSITFVFGGTFAATLARISLGQFFTSFKVGMKSIMHKSVNAHELIEEAVELANIARKEGILSLEGREIGHPFLQDDDLFKTKPAFFEKMFTYLFNGISIKRNPIEKQLDGLHADHAMALDQCQLMKQHIQALENKIAQLKGEKSSSSAETVNNAFILKLFCRLKKDAIGKKYNWLAD